MAVPWVQVTCGIFVQNPRTILCIYSITKISHFLSYSGSVQVNMLSNHTVMKNSDFPYFHFRLFYTVCYSIQQTVTKPDRLSQSLTDIVGNCTVLHRMNPFYSLCGSMVSVQLCTDRLFNHHCTRRVIYNQVLLMLADKSNNFEKLLLAKIFDRMNHCDVRQCESCMIQKEAPQASKWMHVVV